MHVIIYMVGTGCYLAFSIIRCMGDSVKGYSTRYHRATLVGQVTGYALGQACRDAVMIDKYVM